MKKWCHCHYSLNSITDSVPTTTTTTTTFIHTIQLQRRNKTKTINHRKRNDRNHKAIWTIFESVSAGKSRNVWRGNGLPDILTSQLPNPSTHRFSPWNITWISPSYAPPRKGHKLSEKQLIEWNEELEIKQCMIRASSRKQCEAR